MRNMFAIAVLCCPVMAVAQIAPSSGLVCTVSVQGPKACIGPPVIPKDPNNKAAETDLPRLVLTEIRLEAGAAWNIQSTLSDYLIEGINGGTLVNEKTPFRYVSLGKGSVTLLPRGKPFRLRNNSSVTVEFRVIEILR